MTDVEIASRFAVACLFGLLATVLFRDHRKSTTGLMGALFAAAGCMDQITVPFGPRTGLIGAIFQAGSISGIVWFWLLAKSLFDDAFRWRGWYLLVLAVLWAFSLGAYFFTDAFMLVDTAAAFSFDVYKMSLIPQQAIMLVLSALVIYEAAKDWRNDLVESRRRFRQIFLLAAAVLLIVVSFSNFLQLGTVRNPAMDAAGNVVGLVLVLAIAVWLLRIRSDAFSDVTANPFPSSVPADSSDPMIGEINALMTEQQLYTELGLTITMLAERLKEKEYRVRKIINGNMRYRNFNQFLNHFRIQEAAHRLSDPERRRLPILTIAIDVGYGSLAPFNKAFKAIHGVTPTEYRKRHGIR